MQKPVSQCQRLPSWPFSVIFFQLLNSQASLNNSKAIIHLIHLYSHASLSEQEPTLNLPSPQQLAQPLWTLFIQKAMADFSGVQWLGIPLPMQGTWVQSPVQQNPPCCEASKPGVPQLPKPMNPRSRALHQGKHQ